MYRNQASAYFVPRSIQVNAEDSSGNFQGLRSHLNDKPICTSNLHNASVLRSIEDRATNRKSPAYQ